MFSILIVDDEKPAREELKYLLQKILKTPVILEASCGEEALHIIQTESVDLAFIDINMQDMDGLSLSKKIRQLKSETRIVFATAYDAYAVKAFELDAMDYILKPFVEDRIRKTVYRLTRQSDADTGLRNVQEKAVAPFPDKTVKKLSVWRDERIILIDINNVIYLTADDRNTLIKSTMGEFSARESLCSYEKKLESEPFLRVHRSFIINLNQVKEIVPWFNNTYLVKMHGCENDEIPVSRSCIRQFREIFNL